MIVARLLVLLAGAALAGLPLAVLPVRPFAWLGALTALLCAGAALLRSPMLAAAGAAVALLAYTGALWVEGGPADPAGALILGVAVLLALEGAHFAGRFRGAQVAPRVARQQILCWGALAAGGVGAAALVDALGALLVFAAPAWVAPVVAAAAALGTVVGALALLAERPVPPPADLIAP